MSFEKQQLLYLLFFDNSRRIAEGFAELLLE